MAACDLTKALSLTTITKGSSPDECERSTADVTAFKESPPHTGQCTIPRIVTCTSGLASRASISGFPLFSGICPIGGCSEPRPPRRPFVKMRKRSPHIPISAKLQDSEQRSHWRSAVHKPLRTDCDLIREMRDLTLARD